jgi:hypothetical protein
MRRVIRFAVAAAVVAGGVAQAQLQVRPLPVQPGVGRPARPVEYTGPTAGQKAMSSKLVVAGTVSVGKETVDLAQYPQAPVKTTYRVATIKVTDTLVGDKAETVKVLIGPSDPAQPSFDPFPGQPPIPYTTPMPNSIQLIDGQEGVFFLMSHPTAAGQFMPQYGHPPLNPLDSTYKDDLAAVKQVAATYADPIKALKAEKADDRLRAAAALLLRYRQPPQQWDGKPPVEKAIPAEETTLILKAILDADWEKWDKPQENDLHDYTLNPTTLVGQMGLYTGAPGKANFPQVNPKPGHGFSAAYGEAFKQWMDGNGKGYEIKRFVHPGEKTEKK